MHIFYFTKYSRLGASSRLRSYQYFPYLEKAGYTVKVFPLFSDIYLEKLYNGEVSKLTVLSCYFRRFISLFQITHETKVIIEKEFFPYLPGWAEKVLAIRGVKYIVDYDDAIFHNYDKNPNSLIRFLLRHKIDRVMKYSRCVIAGNDYLAKRAQKAGASCIKIIPTVIDENRYLSSDYKDTNSPFVIGWIGSPTTFRNLLPIAPVLKKLAEEGAHIHIIGAEGDLGFSKNLFFKPWKEQTEVENIGGFDVGIMPLEDTPFTRGKCAYKLIQYMGCELPVIASPIGMNREVVEHGVNGFIASSNEEWLEALMLYKNSIGLRQKHGAMGLKLVKEKYTIQSQADNIIQIITGQPECNF